MVETTDPPLTLEETPETLSVILASYQEGENLKRLLPRLKATVDRIATRNQVIVVDTQAPMDDTEQVCIANGVSCVRRRGGNEYGYAIRTGIAESTGDYVVIMDADGSHAPEFIDSLWQARHEADVVIASRYVAGGRTDNPQLLVLASRFLNFVFQAVANIPVLDVSNSFRLYRGDLLRNLELTFLHFDVLEEILAKLLWQNFPPARVAEIPFSFEKRSAGHSKRNLLVFSYHFLRAMFRLRQMGRQFAKHPENHSVLSTIGRLSSDPGPRRFVKFCAVGASGTFVNLGLLWLLTDVFGIYYLHSALISIEASIMSNFILNDSWTFKDIKLLGGSVLHRFLKYNLLCLAGSLLNYLVLWLLTDFAHFNYLISNLFGIVVAFTWNYLVSLKWAWSRRLDKR